MPVKRLSSIADHDIGDAIFVSKIRPTSELLSIDQRLRRLKEEVLPFYPFLLTVPTDVPFRLGNRFVNNWAVGTDGLFAPEEQQLQYMTFLAHHEADSLLLAVGDWADRTGNVMPDRGLEGHSAASTPNGASVKKKISLHDYKHKKHTNEPHASPPESAKQRTSAGGHANPSSSSGSPGRPGVRAVERNAGSPEDVRSPKRPRLSPRQQAEDVDVTNNLPTLISPTLPPTLPGLRLPRLLSPSLPPDIEGELAESHGKSLTRGSLHNKRSSSNSRSVVKEDDDEVPLDHDASFKSNARPDNRHFSQRSSPGVQSRYHSRQERPCLIVKLRYGRPNRRRVGALLKFSGKRSAHSTNSHGKGPDPDRGGRYHDGEEDGWFLGDVRSGHSSTLLPDEPERRGRSRRKVLAATREYSRERKLTASEESTMPFLSSHPSVSVRNEHGTKLLGISAKDGRHPHRMRPSDDNNDSNTHLGPSKITSGPSEVRTMSSPPQPEGQGNNSSHSRNGERRAWRDEFQKYSSLGRELKHAAERHTAKEWATEADEKLAAVTAIEAILCFILAFTADDQFKSLSRQPGDSSTWLSIIAYWRVVKKNSAPYHELYNLCLILGAVSYEAIHALDLERLTICPLPVERTTAPTPGSDGNTVAADDSKKSLKEFGELKERLLECYNKSRKLWIEGTRGLSEDVLTREFPVTWSNRSTDYSNRGGSRLIAGQYSGEYFLPLGKASTPVEVVRFAWAILNEWCDQRSLPFETLVMTMTKAEPYQSMPTNRTAS